MSDITPPSNNNDVNSGPGVPTTPTPGSDPGAVVQAAASVVTAVATTSSLRKYLPYVLGALVIAAIIAGVTVHWHL